jgi:hypothetical protein
MFEQALAQLIDETGSDLAIFCDYEGETIALASHGLDTYDVQLLGAQLCAVVTDLQSLVASTGQSERTSLMVATEKRTILIEGLPGHYYVVLSQPRSEKVPFSRKRLAEVAESFRPEL